ncbi:mechanosensitive ion channel [Lamprobacter modestohalophilus]|uniref:mechanosensitive ion channel family protein n=1 Tax=Lamprobacter modestohalophilus TaxID=1064514 RepID=UPI002ADED235|nr:mechanosensitive ion channel domain-containing protein [Lamprobacter modestohalophilus]MEA1051170.1 mechanosensitive ion channel [Lamprobacter modestohalophilus]
MDTETINDLFRRLDTGALLDLTLILFGTVALILLVQKALPWLANRLHGKSRHYLLALVPLLRLIIVIGAFLLAVPTLIEPSLQNMVAIFGSLGLALGFALKDYASSLVAGIVAVGEAPYRNGDWVQIGATYGEVTHVGMRAVNLVTPDDNLVTIPHSKLWTEPISNANNGSPQLQCTADFYLHPAHDGAQVRALLFDVALTSPYLALGEPIAVVAAEQPWGTRYRLRAYPIDARQQFRFATDLTLRAKAELLRQGFRMAAVPARPEPAGASG